MSEEGVEVGALRWARREEKQEETEKEKTRNTRWCWGGEKMCCVNKYMLEIHRVVARRSWQEHAEIILQRRSLFQANYQCCHRTNTAVLVWTWSRLRLDRMIETQIPFFLYLRLRCCERIFKESYYIWSPSFASKALPKLHCYYSQNQFSPIPFAWCAHPASVNNSPRCQKALLSCCLTMHSLFLAMTDLSCEVCWQFLLFLEVAGGKTCWYDVLEFIDSWEKRHSIGEMNRKWEGIGDTMEMESNWRKGESDCSEGRLQRYQLNHGR